MSGAYRAQPIPAATASHVEVVIGIVLFWLAIGALAVLRPNHPGAITRVLYLLGFIAGDHAGHTDCHQRQDKLT